jgi:hypothetical protein
MSPLMLRNIYINREFLSKNIDIVILVILFIITILSVFNYI